MCAVSGAKPSSLLSPYLKQNFICCAYLSLLISTLICQEVRRAFWDILKVSLCFFNIDACGSKLLYGFLSRKRQREEEIEAQEKAKREREWQKNFEVISRLTQCHLLNRPQQFLAMLLEVP